ncbi:MAG: flagellar filament capping protein FliD [Desulfobulbaceae bacterium]|nr:flagellar filament capping protein FliD [Desulfobulbaceae bacterium]HIJ79499.1 flagellar filament capping protein FliD [Deltaproteobacteria bacterium]
MTTGTISTLGVGSGLDLQSILEQLRDVDEQTVRLKEADVTALDAQVEEFTVVKNKLLDMKSQALTLSLSSTFLARSATSSDDSVATVTVAEGATVQSKSLEVVRMAQKSIFQSSTGMAAATSVLTGVDATVGYKLGDTTISIEVPAGTTLQGLADLINNDLNNPGLSASVIDNGSDENSFYLTFEANETGEDYRISNISNLVMTEVQGNGTSLNAEIKVGGVTYQRQDNSINDVISGVTLDLQAIGTSTVRVTANHEEVTTLIQDMVAAYNDVVQDVKQNLAYDEETGEFGVLAGTTLRDLTYTLQNMMTSTVEVGTDNSITSLFDIGLAFERDGSISIDEVQLANALAATPDDVRDFFVGDTTEDIEGFADILNDRLRSLTGGTGIIEAEKTAAQEKIYDLELSIEAETERLNKRYDVLTRQFVQLDQYMSQMTSMSNYLKGQFDSFSAATAKK